MNLINDFLPKDGPPTPIKIWKTYGILFLIFSIVMAFSRGDMLTHTLLEAGIILLCLVLAVIDREVISVTISGMDSTFVYRTMDCFGKERETSVYLPTATVNYKYTRIAKNKKGWRLRLYNNFFKNRVTIKEEMDYSQEQMDKMVEVINKYRPVGS